MKRLLPLIAVLLAGCSQQVPAATPPPLSSPSPSSPSPAPASVSTCLDTDLKVVLTAQDEFRPEATMHALVQATNVSDHTCRVTGWIAVSLVDAAGVAKPVSGQQVDLPGPPEPVDVDPGEYAPAGIKWTQCDPGDGSCRTGNTIQVTIPGGKPRVATLEDFPPPERSGIAFSGLQIGTFQPSRIGVVAW